jgi:hypothetical protein
MFQSNLFLFAHLSVPFCCCINIILNSYEVALWCSLCMSFSSCIRLMFHSEEKNNEPFRIRMSNSIACAWIQALVLVLVKGFPDWPAIFDVLFLTSVLFNVCSNFFLGKML